MPDAVPYTGPNLGPLQPQGSPAGSKWGVVKTEPLAAATPPVAPAQPDAPPPSSGGWIAKAMEPITSYLPTQRKMAEEGMARMGEGASELGTPGSRLSGGWKVVSGAADYVASPINAALHTVVGKPLEENTGIPHEYSEFAAGLAIPGIGFSRTTQGQQAISAARNAGKVLEKIVSPETVDADARAAAGTIRELYGQAARHTAMTEHGIESGWKTVNAMPAADRLNFIDYIEGRSTRYAGATLPRDQQALADTLRTAFEQRMAKLQALPKHAQQGFVEDYFPHFWKDPQKAANTPMSQSTGAAGRQGSGASLKQRSVPTIADGIAAGLEPVTDHPLEATMRYITSMDRFIASEAVMQTAKDQGYVRFIKPKVVGASGHPESFQVPEGWTALEGRGATNGAGAKAYAPDGFARVYNNFISQGFQGIGPEYGNMYDAARHATNAITGLELSLSGYHFMTVAKAALDNSLANAINLLRSGKPIEAVKQAAKTPLAPFSYARSGKQVKDVYLGLSQGSRELQKTVEMLERSGGRARGKSPDYEFSGRGSYKTALNRGALKIQWDADRAEARGASSRSYGEARFIAKQFGRLMDTVAAPLFEQYIPAIKNGAFRENLGTWLKMHPNATDAEQVHAARQLWDTIDDRFGEMVQDNMFMNKFGKQLGMLFLRSWSWTVGQDVRMMGGAARDIARAPFKKVTGTGPNDTRWTQKMDMAIAAPIVYGTLAMLYQLWKTGEPPKDLHDLIAPRTGGADASTGEPERLIMPGPEKDVFGFYEHPVQEATNKIGTLPKQAGQLLLNEDYRGDPIYPEGGKDTPPAVLEIAKYLGSDLFPIMLKNLWRGQKEGSALGTVETLAGVRTAPRYLTDPQGYDEMMQSIHGRKWREKINHDRKQDRLYGGGE